MKRLDSFFEKIEAIENCIGENQIQANPIVSMLDGSQIIIYGAGALGREVYNYLLKQNVSANYFCSGINGGYVDKITQLEVLRADRLCEFQDAVVIMAIGDTATPEEKETIKVKIREAGIAKVYDHNMFEEKVSPTFLLNNREKISQVYHLLKDEKSREVFIQKLYYMLRYDKVDFMSTNKMYLDEDLVNLKTDGTEVIIDAGAFNGDTASMFREMTSDDTLIYSFEPDSGNYSKLIERCNCDANIVTVNAGLWDEKDVLSFSDDQCGSSHINPTGKNSINVIDLDSFCSEKGVVPTYIKMDIEGAEIQALQGAEKVLLSMIPTLAICLYHKVSDIFEIPLLINEIQKDYDFYIRHYSDNRTDTLLYAIPKYVK